MPPAYYSMNFVIPQEQPDPPLPTLLVQETQVIACLIQAGGISNFNEGGVQSKA